LGPELAKKVKDYQDDSEAEMDYPLTLDHYQPFSREVVLFPVVL
jgi:hypothetical protein